MNQVPSVAMKEGMRMPVWTRALTKLITSVAVMAQSTAAKPASWPCTSSWASRTTVMAETATAPST